MNFESVATIDQPSTGSIAPKPSCTTKVKQQPTEHQMRPSKAVLRTARDDCMDTHRAQVQAVEQRIATRM